MTAFNQETYFNSKKIIYKSKTNVLCIKKENKKYYEKNKFLVQWLCHRFQN